MGPAATPRGVKGAITMSIVKQSFGAFRKAGMLDAALKLYEGDRHEVLNEKDKAKVWADVLAWLEAKRA